MSRDVLQKCVNTSQVGSSRVLSIKSLINLASEALDKQTLDQSLKYLQDNVSNLVTDEGNYITVMEKQGNDYVIRVNPYEGLQGKKASETQPYIDQLRQKYGNSIPTIPQIIELMNKSGPIQCQGISFNSVKYPWFDPETLKLTDKEAFFTTKTVGDRSFIITSGVSLSRVEQKLEVTQSKLRSLRLRMVGLFLIVWSLITFVCYKIFKTKLLPFIITGIIGIIVVFVQIKRPLPSSDEPEIYNSLSTTIKAIAVTLGSLSILVSNLDIKNKVSIQTLFLIGFIFSLIGVVVTPRKENIEKVHQINDILRVIIAISVTSLLTGIVISFL